MRTWVGPGRDREGHATAARLGSVTENLPARHGQTFPTRRGLPDLTQGEPCARLIYTKHIAGITADVIPATTTLKVSRCWMMKSYMQLALPRGDEDFRLEVDRPSATFTGRLRSGPILVRRKCPDGVYAADNVCCLRIARLAMMASR
jgi:hypothetical protein